VITCPNCGKQNQDHYKFCLGCGSELPRDQVKAPVHTAAPTPPSGMPAIAPAPVRPTAAGAAPARPAPAQPAAQPAPAPAPVPAKCSNCGSDIPEGFKFCGRCGTPIVAKAEAPAAAPVPSPAAPAVQARGRIILIQPDGSEGASMPVPDDGVAIGRSAGGPFAEDYFLSMDHARFKFSGSSLVVEDLGSVNGVYVRLVPEQRYDLNPGDTLRLGQEVLLFDMLPAPAKGADGTEPMGSPRKDAWGRLSLVIGKGKFGNAFLLEGDEILLGRERGHIIFPEDGYVSGLHLKITRAGGKASAVDVGSSNGTYLRIKGSGTVNPGDYVLMGQYLYRMEY